MVSQSHKWLNHWKTVKLYRLRLFMYVLATWRQHFSKAKVSYWNVTSELACKTQTQKNSGVLAWIQPASLTLNATSFEKWISCAQCGCFRVSKLRRCHWSPDLASPTKPWAKRFAICSYAELARDFLPLDGDRGLQTSERTTYLSLGLRSDHQWIIPLWPVH